MSSSSSDHGGLQSVPETEAVGKAEMPTPPSPIVTRRDRRLSVDSMALICRSERAALNPQKFGRVKYFCRQRGHGYITPNAGGDDLFVHITDIEGEFVPHQGDKVSYKECPCPPKPDRVQAIHVHIEDLAPGERHERWDQPPTPHAHPHPTPNIEATRSPPPRIPQ